MNRQEDCSLRSLLVKFSSVFTAPSYSNFVMLVHGWVLCVGRHSLTRVLQFGSTAESWGKHHSTFYRFLGRARWAVDGLGKVVVGLALAWIPPAAPIYLLVDDTLARRSGPHLWGGAMHHDALQSTYARNGQDAHVAFAFGHSWVLVSMWVPLPWNSARGVALPIAWRLFRPQRQCADGSYRKRTELALELLKQVDEWLPSDRRVIVAGDTEYTCRTVLRDAPSRPIFVGPMCMDAALYKEPVPTTGRGRPRKKGERLNSPKQLAEDDSIPWEQRTLQLYRHAAVDVLFKTQVALWYHVTGTRLVRMIVTRDPKGRTEDRAYVTTDPTMTVEDVATCYARRWSVEVMHAQVKQHLGAEHPQNGWWKRSHGTNKPANKPGPQPHQSRGQLAVERTFPCALVICDLVILWYFANGTPDADVRAVRARCPWYRHKTDVSFSDMLAALRCHLARRLIDKPGESAVIKKDGPTPTDAGGGLYDLLFAA